MNIIQENQLFNELINSIKNKTCSCINKSQTKITIHPSIVFYSKNDMINKSNLELLCNVSHKMKLNVLSIENNNDTYFAINFDNKSVFINNGSDKYVFDILSKYKIAHYVDDTNALNSKLLSSHSYIKSTLLDSDRLDYTLIDYRFTNIKHVRIYNEDGTQNCLIKWLTLNTQIYSIKIYRCFPELFDFLTEFPNHSLQYIKCVDPHNNKKLQLLLKEKRIKINNIILIIFLIMNSNHKYKKYLPKPIMKIILTYVYDVDFIENYEYYTQYNGKYTRKSITNK